MNPKRRPDWFSLVALIALVGCAGPREVIRNEIKLSGDSSLTLDGLTVSVRLLDVDAIKADPRLSRKLTYTPVGSSGALALLAGTQGFMTLVNPPAFELKVRNQTGHVVRLQGTVIKLIDGSGSLYEALDRGTAEADLDSGLAAARSKGYEVSPSDSQELRSALSKVKFLTENGQLLPDISETFIVAFSLPFGQTEKEMNEWFAKQASFRLKVFDLPTRTNEAGAVTKRVSFEFPVTVKTFRETYADGSQGRKLVASEAVEK
jgi:hypothetical protein